MSLEDYYTQKDIDAQYNEIKGHGFLESDAKQKSKGWLSRRWYNLKLAFQTPSVPLSEGDVEAIKTKAIRKATRKTFFRMG